MHSAAGDDVWLWFPLHKQTGIVSGRFCFVCRYLLQLWFSVQKLGAQLVSLDDAFMPVMNFAHRRAVAARVNWGELASGTGRRADPLCPDNGAMIPFYGRQTGRPAGLQAHRSAFMPSPPPSPPPPPPPLPPPPPQLPAASVPSGTGRPQAPRPLDLSADRASGAPPRSEAWPKREIIHICHTSWLSSQSGLAS